ncbi:MAG: transporter [Bacillales bacterium]|nr:transporter [Bacillales bacterium]
MKLLKNYSKKESSWAIYDWANSAFTLVIITAIMPVYFKSVAENAGISDATSTAYWGYATSVGTLLLAIIAPILGSIAAYKGYKKKIFSFFLYMGVLFTFGLAVIPNDNWVLLLALYVIAFFSFEATVVVYDSFLVDVTDDSRMNRVSSFGYALGYFGSCIPFILCMAMILLVPDANKVQATKISFIITGLWWLLFTIPLFKNVEQIYGVEKEKHMISKSFSRLFETMKSIRQHRNVLLFLLAFFFYIDGVNTVISMAAAFATDIGMESDMLMILIFIIQVVAIPFAILYGKLGDKFGAKRMIYFGIFTYIVLCIAGYFTTSNLGIWLIAFLIGSAQGGIQALSRAYFSKIIPKEKSNEYFGFYSIFSKFAAIIGPTLMAYTIHQTNNTNAGVLSLAVLFIIGGIIFYFVEDDRKIIETK